MMRAPIWPCIAAMPRSLFVCALALASAIMLLMAPAAIPQESVSQEDAHRQLRESQRNLEAAKAREKEISGNLEQLEKERAALNKDLIETAKSIQVSEASLTKIETRVASLTEQENQVRASIAQRHATIAELLAAMQRIARAARRRPKGLQGRPEGRDPHPPEGVSAASRCTTSTARRFLPGGRGTRSYGSSFHDGGY